jgi:exodeoxyribonuclease VII small subunit
MSEQIKYSEALSELESIVSALQSDNCDIDTMVAKTKRASELLKICRSRLTATEQELKDVLAELQNAGERQ